MKKRTLMRVVSSALSLSLLLSALTGCGGTTETGSTSGSSGTGDSSDGSESKYAETLTIDVFDSQANYQGIQTGWFADVVKEKISMQHLKKQRQHQTNQ